MSFSRNKRLFFSFQSIVMLHDIAVIYAILWRERGGGRERSI